MRITPVILAAGQGTRMKSKLPKVLHEILGEPLISHSLRAVGEVTTEAPVVVVGYGAEAVREVAGEEVRFVHQAERLGTGHAVQQTTDLLKGQTDFVLVAFADMPLLTAKTFQMIIDTQLAHDGPFTMLTAVDEKDQRGFGRIIRDSSGHVHAIVEEAVATPEQLMITELNTSVYCFRADWLWDALPRIPLSPKGEYYLTDVVELARLDDLPVKAVKLEDPDEAIGINTRIHLAEAAAYLQRRITQAWMIAGVTFVDPTSTYIEADVRIGRDTIIHPNTHLQGNTKIGEDCVVGPNSLVRDTQMGDRCKVVASVLEEAILEDEVDIGPFGHLRKGAHLAQGVHMGNFGEVKNSYLGPGVKMGHFSYLGDATLGENVNVGAGTITCNYDGKTKNKTIIGDNTFIGSDTMLVAPLALGDGARTGAGAVVTKDVPDDTLAVGIPARNIRSLRDES
jgi:bifunctional UDP-N-acetylglucosamine pyrophosphorylase/glucosamine-1-phosphate N-acetyltransferase